MKTKKIQHIDENDFEALDKLAHSITIEDTRPLNARERKEWESAKRGRPRKSRATKAVPTMITLEPKLLKEVDAATKRLNISRSQLIAESLRQRLGLAGVGGVTSTPVIADSAINSDEFLTIPVLNEICESIAAGLRSGRVKRMLPAR